MVSRQIAGAAGALTLCALLVSSCNEDAKPVVSLEQAKQITTEMRGQGFTPPPRTIDDITAILDLEKPDRAKMEANSRAADAQPGGLTGVPLANFYLTRGLAARDLGRVQQSLADLRTASTLARGQAMNVSRIRQAIGGVEDQMGRSDSSIVQSHSAYMATIPANSIGVRLLGNANYATAQVRLGDFEGAARSMADVQKDYDDWSKKPASWNWGVFKEQITATLLVGYATIDIGQGRLSDAELKLREAAANDDLSRSKDALMNERSVFPVPFDPYRVYEPARVRHKQLLINVLIARGKLIEAEAIAREQLLQQLHLAGKYAPETGARLVDLGKVIDAQGRHADAEKLALAAVETYQGVGAGKGSWTLAAAYDLAAQAQTSQRRWQDAATTYGELERLFIDDLGGRERFFRNNITLALVYLNVGRAAEAIEILQRVADARARSFGDTHVLTAEARGLLGAALAKSGARDAALKEFSSTIPALISAMEHNDGDGGVLRDDDQRMVLDAYIGLLSAGGGARSMDVAAETFRLADIARRRSVQQAVISSSARAKANDPALTDLVRREQDAQLQIATLGQTLNNILSQPSDTQDAGTLAKLRGQISALRDAQTSIQKEILRRFPDYAQLTNPAPATVEQVQRSLRPGEALITTYVGEEKTFVWVVPQAGPVAFAAVPLGHERVKKMVKSLRKALDPTGLATYSDVLPYDVKTAHELYAALLKPVEAGWRGAKKLLVVAQGPLGPLPFDVLVTEPYEVPALKPGEALFSNYRDVPWLGRQVAITWLPSVTSLAALRNIPAPPETRRAFVGFGDPWFNQRQAEQAQREAAIVTASAEGTTRGLQLLQRSAPADNVRGGAVLSQLIRLPDTVAEVRSIGAALGADPEQDIFLGARASEHRVETMDLSNRKVVLFATHGLMTGQLDGLTEPALALTAPSISGDGGDGLLSLSKIMGLRLNADWVVLSACNTGAGDGAGAEAVSGLGRGFFYAGARALLVTHWPVETTSAQMETVELFRRQAADPKLNRAEALQQAKLAVINGGLTDKSGRLAFSYAHPMFWAPYALVGDPG